MDKIGKNRGKGGGYVIGVVSVVVLAIASSWLIARANNFKL